MSFDLYVDIPKCLANFKPFRIHLKMLDFFLHKKENVKRKNKTKILPTKKVLNEKLNETKFFYSGRNAVCGDTELYTQYYYHILLLWPTAVHAFLRLHVYESL